MNNDPPFCDSCGVVFDSAAPGGLCPRCLMAGAMRPTEPSAETAPRPPPSIAEVGAAFPLLEILDVVGRGGMGWVFKARQPKLNRYVALKLLPSSLAERDSAFAGRFEREGQLLARLHHPNIVAVHDSGTAGGFFYLLMEYVEGVNLRQAMRSSRFTPAQALAIVPHICDALQFAHDEGVLHRDIKPENILLDAKGRVKLADFGIAKLIGAGADPQAGESAVVPELHLTRSGAMLGTPSYMAPEQRDTPSDVDHRADIYSLGVVFYELLTGELPTGSFAPPSAKSATDPRVDAIVQQALQKERTRRQSSAGEMKTQVETVAGTGGTDVPPAGPGGVPGSASAGFLGSPRFSRKAIVGACWAGLAVIASIWLTALTGESVTEWHGMNHPEKLGFLLTECIGIAGFLAPFGTTILGWVAVAQIRRSAGALHGLWLATFDGLLFPLLAIDAVIGRAWVGLVGALIAHRTDASLSYAQTLDANVANHITNGLQHSTVTIALLASAVTALIVDVLIVRRVWRALNNSLDGRGMPAPAEAREYSKSILGRVAICVAGAGGALGIAIFCLFPILPPILIWSIFTAALVGIAMGVLSRKSRSGRRAIAIGGATIAILVIVAATPQFPSRIEERARSFGPTIERVVTGGINLPTGQLTELPLPQPLEERDPARYAWFNHTWKGDHESAYPWMRQRGIDVMDLGNHGLMGVDIILKELEEDDWRTLTPDGLRERLRSLQVKHPPAFWNFPNSGGTYGFQTRDGATGILQGVNTDLPRGVRIRYKLALGAPAVATAIVAPSSKPTVVADAHPDPSKASGDIVFGPLIERTMNLFDAESPTAAEDTFIGFAGNRVASTPKTILDEGQKAGGGKPLWDWIRREKLDAQAQLIRDQGQVDGVEFYGADLTARQIPNGQWDGIAPSGVTGELEKWSADEVRYPSMKALRFPTTYVFCARDIGLGVLQIISFNEEKKTVKIRYKLAQGQYDASALILLPEHGRDKGYPGKQGQVPVTIISKAGNGEAGAIVLQFPADHIDAGRQNVTPPADASSAAALRSESATPRFADPTSAIELKVAQQQLEKTLADSQDTQVELALLPSNTALSDAEVKAAAIKLNTRLQVLADQAKRLRELILQNAPKP